MQDVAWHCHHRDMFASVGDDKRLLMCAPRPFPHSLPLLHGLSPRGIVRVCVTLHCGVSVCLFVCLWGVRSWDRRDSSKPRLDCVAHDAEVNCVAFNPFQVRTP